MSEKVWSIAWRKTRSAGFCWDERIENGIGKPRILLRVLEHVLQLDTMRLRNVVKDVCEHLGNGISIPWIWLKLFDQFLQFGITQGRENLFRGRVAQGLTTRRPPIQLPCVVAPFRADGRENENFTPRKSKCNLQPCKISPSPS